MVRSALIPPAQVRQGNDPIFALNGEAARRRDAGESILNATLGVLTDEAGRLATMPVVAETLATVPAAAAAGYAPIAGVPAFLDATIADLFGGSPLAEQAVSVATPGGTGAIYQAVMNFLEPGQRALTTDHYWGPYAVITEHAGRGLDVFRTFGSDGRFDVDALAGRMAAHADTQGRVLLLLNFPCHNPTGYSLDEAEWSALADAVEAVSRQAPVAVLIDAAYVGFAAEDRLGHAVGALLDHATVLVAWTASKSFTQYGARIGAIVALHREAGERSRLRDALGYSCRATWSNCNHVGQLAIAEIVGDDALRRRADDERAYLRAMLRERVAAFDASGGSDLDVPRHEGGFFLSVFTPDAQHTAAVMRESGVYVVPLEGAVRVAVCSTPQAEIPRLTEALTAGVVAARERV